MTTITTFTRRPKLREWLRLALLSVCTVSVCTIAVCTPGRAEEVQLTFVELHHVAAADVIQFLRDTPSLTGHIEEGRVRALPGKPKSLVVELDPTTTESIIRTIRSYAALEIRERIHMEPLRINYASVQLILESLAAAGICQVWHRTEETQTDQTKQGNQTITHTYKRWVYAQYDAAKGDNLVSASIPDIPYVIEVPHVDPIEIPPVNMGTGAQDSFSLDFPDSPSTEERNRILVVGTPQDIEAVTAYVQDLDKPAKQVMIECQIIELNANSLKDLGVDLVSGAQRHNTVSFATPAPGDAIPQPSDAFAPIEQAGLAFLFDDQQPTQSGRFLAGLHALIRNGEAVIKARPKLYTLDDRQNVLHIGEEVPTFQSTSVQRDVTGGNFVEQVNNVAKQYVGITVNVRPRISGPVANEVSMLVDIQINNLIGRDRVFAEDLLGVPTVAVRKFRGQARIRNHRPLILGGLIRESDVQSSTKLPFIGDFPLIGELFGRKNSQRERTEIIMVLTPHIINETGVDPVATPKESLHFDTFNSVLFNDRYVLKGRDLVGLDPISRSPVQGYTAEEVLDLTLLSIVKRRELVKKLRIFDEYIPDEAMKLSLYKRSFPEKSVRYWTEEERKIFFQAAAIVIENIKNLNPDLTYDELIEPRREIILPNSPYHVSLSYEKLKPFYEKGGEVIMRDGGVELRRQTIDLLSELKERDLREFGDFLVFAGRTPEDHGQFKSEIIKYYYSLYPNAGPLEDLPYPKIFEVLSKDGVGFVGIATYLSSKLDGQYAALPPKFGMLEQDLEHFRDRNVSLRDLADRLEALDQRWSDLNRSDDRPVQGL
ncbi:MAG: hypothetical protein KDC38_12680 [Planctomycetes bacterium]|nr:hypothetical protein [Planctomycetota bacterium]